MSHDSTFWSAGWAFPAGYLEGMQSGKNLPVGPLLRSLYRDVQFAVSGDLDDHRRWAAIYWLLVHGHRGARARSFDKDAVGMAGLEVVDTSIRSCLGWPYAQVAK